MEHSERELRTFDLAARPRPSARYRSRVGRARPLGQPRRRPHRRGREIGRRIIRVIGREFINNRRVSIRHGDALWVKWPPGTQWDAAWYDLWTEEGSNELHVMHARSCYTNIAGAAPNEIIKREVMEGEKADEARKKIARALNKSLRVVPLKVDSVTTAGDLPQTVATDSSDVETP